MTESQLIDHLLGDYKLGYDTGGMSHDDLLLYPGAIQKMKAYGLIQDNGRSKTILEKGFQVLDAGGFDAWQAAIKREAEQKRKEEIAALKATQGSTRATWIASVAAVAALIFGFTSHTGPMKSRTKSTS